MIWLGIVMLVAGTGIFCLMAFLGPLDSETGYLITLPIMLVLFGAFIIYTKTVQCYRKEAIAGGYAEYVIINPETGITEWK